MWTYRCYDDGREPNLWQRWYDENEDFRGQHDAVFGMIEQLDQWGEPHTKLFNKKHRIFEVRLPGDVKHRFLGVFGDARKEFVILGTCYHKQSNYYPHDILNTVVKRLKAMNSGTGKATTCDRPKHPS